MSKKEEIYWTKADWLVLGLIILCFFFSAALWTRIPDIVPVHWNIQGQPDRFGPKFINLFLLPVLSLFVLAIMSYLPRLDPFAKNYRRFAKVFQVFKLVISAFFLYLYVIILYASSLQQGFSAKIFFIPAFSVLFIIIGYYLPQLKRNFFIGIRTPWTLSSDKSWNKSHHLAGRIFILAGIANLIGIFLPATAAFYLFLGILITGGLIITIYSYWVYQQDRPL